MKGLFVTLSLTRFLLQELVATQLPLLRAALQMVDTGCMNIAYFRYLGHLVLAGGSLF